MHKRLDPLGDSASPNNDLVAQGKTKEQLAWSLVEAVPCFLLSTLHLSGSTILKMIQTLASGPSHILASFNPLQRQEGSILLASI